MAVAGVINPCWHLNSFPLSFPGLLFFKTHTSSIPVYQHCKAKFWFVKKVPVRSTIQLAPSFRPICASMRSNDQYGLSYGDGYDEEPFWLSIMKDIAWSLRSVAVFLAEQPSQLKYIEWPTFQSTLKTATLTLVLVALLIVALSSIDSCLYYVLALLLRKTA